MNKTVFRILVLLMLVSMLLCAFIACDSNTQDINIEFLSGEQVLSNALSIEDAKAMLNSQPSMDGYIFMGWFLDKDTWTQKVSADDVEAYVQEGKLTVYAYWIKADDTVIIAFYDYNGGLLLEREFDRNNVDFEFLKASQKPDDDMYTYTFAGWECDMSNTELTYYVATPKYNKEYREFSVEYYVDEELVYTEFVKYGENANPDIIVDPTKDSTAEYDFVFEGWEGNTQNITEDTKLVAKFSQQKRMYNVTFYYGFNNSKYHTEKVAYGEAAPLPTDDQVKRESSAQYNYEFLGWDKDTTCIVADTYVHALYSQTLRSFEVDFLVDGVIIKSETVVYGNSAVAPANITKEADKANTYTFAGWDKKFDNVTSDLQVNAIFDATPIQYTITFIDWNDVVLATKPMTYDSQITLPCDDITPSRPSSDMYDYVFEGWVDTANIQGGILSKVVVNGNMTLKAQYKQNIRTFDVVFNYGDNKTTTISDVPYGTRLDEENEYSIQVPTLEDVKKTSTDSTDYEFIGWSQTFDYVASDLTINAVYREEIRQFLVQFMVDDVCIKSEYVLYGEGATAPENPTKEPVDGYTYTFWKWDSDAYLSNVTSDLIINAKFLEQSHKYTVQFINWDGTILYTAEVMSSQAAVYPVEYGTPQRESNDRYTYEFIGWTDEESLEKVTKSFSVYAQYEQIERTYTVTFLYGDNQEVVIENVPYGTNMWEPVTETDKSFAAQIPTNVEKSSTAQYDYTFIDWDKYFGYVSYDMTINAIYKETIRKYIVTFVNDGSVIKTQEVAYGECPTAPELSAYKQDTVQYKYTYLGWGIITQDGVDYVDNAENYQEVLPNSTAVEGEITYTAIYLRAIQQYTVEFYNDVKDSDGNYVLAKSVTVDYATDLTNEAPVVTKESTQKYDYTFAGWDKDITFVQSNMKVYAVYTETIRKYTVTFMNGEEVYAEYKVEYGSASPVPEVDPTKQSTPEFDFVFIGWDGTIKYIESDTIVTANYRSDLRSYEVQFYNLLTNELVEKTQLYYGSEITKVLERDGYIFDSWYKDPYCNTRYTGNVDGPLTLFGNLYMEGFVAVGDTITGYYGDVRDIVVPTAMNGTKITKIKGSGSAFSAKNGAFYNNDYFDTIFIPSTITEVGSYAFVGAEDIKIYVQSDSNWIGNKPDGWGEYWAANYLGDATQAKKEIVYNILGIYAVNGYEYIMSRDGYSIITKFTNYSTDKAYIESTVDFDVLSYNETTVVDEKTGIEYKLYGVSREARTYNITQIGYRAFRGADNLNGIFIPKTIEKVENYAFSGITTNLYIAMEQPEVLGVPNNLPSGWGALWNFNDGEDEGERTLHWGVVAMGQVGDYGYVFKSNQTAVITEFHGTTILDSKLEIPATVTYSDANTPEATYKVIELGDGLFESNMTLSSIVIPEGVERIGEKVFYFNTKLSSVTLPSTLKEIGAYAFIGTMALKEIYIPANVEKIGMACFAGSSTTLYMGRDSAPSGYITTWNVKIGFEEISNLDLSDIKSILETLVNLESLPTYYNVKYIYTVEAKETGRSTTFKYILYNDNNARLIGYDGGLTLNVETYTIPSTIDYNGEIFNVVSIGANALNGAGIKTLNIPASVTYIEANGFAGCDGMTINTAHATQPEEWVDGFNPLGLTINYGVTV